MCARTRENNIILTPRPASRRGEIKDSPAFDRGERIAQRLIIDFNVAQVPRTGRANERLRISNMRRRGARRNAFQGLFLIRDDFVNQLDVTPIFRSPVRSSGFPFVRVFAQRRIQRVQVYTVRGTPDYDMII